MDDLLSLDQLQKTDAPPSGLVTLDEAQNTGTTSPVIYRGPKEEPNILTRIAGDIANPIIESLPQTIAGAEQMFGDLLPHKDHRNDILARGMAPANFFDKAMDVSLGDRIMRQGIQIREANKKMLADFGQDIAPNIADQALRLAAYPAAGIGLMAMGVSAPVMTAVFGLGMGTSALINAYNTMRAKNEVIPWALARAVPNGVGQGLLGVLPIARGLTIYKQSVGTWMKQTIDHAVSGAITFGAMGVGSGALNLATGLTEYKGPEDLKNIIGGALEDAAVGVVLMGSTGAVMASRNVRAIKNELVKTGMDPKVADVQVNDLMAQTTDKVATWVENHVDATPEQQNRIITMHSGVQERIAQIQEKIAKGVKLDPLDYEFIPKNDVRPTKEQQINSDVERLSGIKKEMTVAQEVLKGNVEDQRILKSMEADRKVVEKEVNSTFDKNLKDVHTEFDAKDDALAAESKTVAKQLESVMKQEDAAVLRLKAEDARLAKGESSDPMAEKPLGSTMTKKYSELKYDVKRLGDEKAALLDRQREIPNDRIMNAKQREGTVSILERSRVRAVEEKMKEAPTLQRAAKELEQKQAEYDKLKEKIDAAKEALKAPGTKLTQLQSELRELKRGVKFGNKLHREKFKAAAEELKALLSDDEMGLKDKKDLKSFYGKLDAIADAVDPEAKFRELLPEISNRIVQLNQRIEKKQWREDIAKVQKNLSKLPVEYQDKLGPLLDSLDLHFRNGKEIKIREKTRAWIQSKLGEGNPTDADGKPKLTADEQRVADLVNQRNLSEISHEELQAIHDYVMAQATYAARYDALAKTKEARAFEENIKGKLDHIQEQVKLRERDIPGEQTVQENRTQLKKITDGAKWWNKAATAPVWLFDKLGFRREWDMIQASRQRSLEFTRTDKEQIDKLMSHLDPFELFGKPIPIEFENVGKTYSWTKMPGDKGVDASNAARRLNTYLKIYAQAQNEKGRNHLVNTPGLSEGLVSKIEAWLEKEYPKHTKAVFDVMEYFAPGGDAFARLDEAVVADRGHHLTAEEHWDPIQRLINVPKGDLEWGAKGAYYRGAASSGFTNSRVNSNLSFADFDWAGDIMRHVTDRNHYIEMQPVLSDLHQLLHDPRIVDAIEQHPDAGKEAVQMMRKYLNDVAFNGHYLDTQLARQAANLRQNVAAAKIGFNVISSLKTFVQFPVGAGHIGWGWATHGLKEYTADMAGWEDFIHKNSLFMKHYDARREPVLAEMTYLEKTAFGAHAKLNELKQLGWVLHREANKVTSRSIWLGQYFKSMTDAKMEGLTDAAATERAVKESDEAVYKTQTTGDLIYQPHLFREGELGRTLGMFHTDINKNFNLWANDIDKIKGGEASKTILIGSFISRAIAPAILLGLLEKRRPLQDDELAAYLADQTIGTQPLAGIFTNSWVQGKFSPPMIPAAQALNDLWTTVVAKTPEGHFKAGIETIADYTGIPLGVIYREFSGSAFQPKIDRKAVY